MSLGTLQALSHLSCLSSLFLQTEMRAHNHGSDANLTIRRFVHIFVDARTAGDDELAAGTAARDVCW